MQYFKVGGGNKGGWDSVVLAIFDNLRTQRIVRLVRALILEEIFPIAYTPHLNPTAVSCKIHLYGVVHYNNGQLQELILALLTLSSRIDYWQ